MSMHKENLEIAGLLDGKAPMVAKHPLFATLPQEMVFALVRYLATGHPLGGFLTALVEGDFFRAACNADSDNNRRLADFGIWIQQTWPPRSFGSGPRMDEWYDHDGLKGQP